MRLQQRRMMALLLCLLTFAAGNAAAQQDEWIYWYNIAEAPSAVYDDTIINVDTGEMKKRSGSTVHEVRVQGGRRYYVSQVNGGRNATWVYTAQGEAICSFVELTSSYGRVVAMPENAAILRYTITDVYPERTILLEEHIALYDIGYRGEADGTLYVPQSVRIDAYLPPDIYCAVGRTVELYNDQVCLQAGKYHVRWVCNVGSAMERKFSVTGRAEHIGNYPLTCEIYDDSMKLLWSGTTTLHIVDSELRGRYTICPIGDSLTHAKPWLAEVENLAEGHIGYVGSIPWRMQDAQGNTRTGGHEGRSGFSAAGYLSATPHRGSVYGGVDEPAHHAFWNPRTQRFDWAYYKQTTGVEPEVVQIYLGTNGISLDNTANVAGIVRIVQSIRQDDPDIPIFVVNTIYRSGQNGIGVQQMNGGYNAQGGQWKYQEDMKVMDLMQKLDAALAGMDGVYMINLALTHDTRYNFGSVQAPVNPRAEQVEYLPVDSVHPTVQGYYQMADVMFSVYCGILE